VAAWGADLLLAIRLEHHRRQTAVLLRPALLQAWLLLLRHPQLRTCFIHGMP